MPPSPCNAGAALQCGPSELAPVHYMHAAVRPAFVQHGCVVAANLTVAAAEIPTAQERAMQAVKG